MSILKEFPTYAGMKTSDSNGRTVIDKFFGTNRRGNVDPVWDSGTAYTAGQYVWFPDKFGDIYRALEDTSVGESPDTHSAKWDSINAEWSGNDRPELHQNLDGKYQACVEKETTNAVPTNALKFDNWTTYGDYSVTIEQGHAIPGVTDDGATKITLTGSDTSFGRALRSPVVDIEDEYTGESGAQCVIYNTGNNAIRIVGGRLGGDSVTNHGNYIAPSDIGLSRIYSSTSDDGTKRIIFGLQNEENAEFIAFQPQAEKSAYPTLFTEGTRPAPEPVIENALPETGTVAVYVDFVYAPGQAIFTNFGSSLANDRFELEFNVDNTRASSFGRWVSLDALDTLFPSITPNNRYKMLLMLTYDFEGNDPYLYLIDADGNGYELIVFREGSPDYEDASLKDITLGRGRFASTSSVHFKNIYIDNKYIGQDINAVKGIYTQMTGLPSDQVTIE